MKSLPEILRDNRPRTAGVPLHTAAIEMAPTWRVGNFGSIVCDCPPDCPESGSKTEQDYGGHFVCESVTGSLAEFIVKAAKLAHAVRVLR